MLQQSRYWHWADWVEAKKMREQLQKNWAEKERNYQRQYKDLMTKDKQEHVFAGKLKDRIGVLNKSLEEKDLLIAQMREKERQARLNTQTQVMQQVLNLMRPKSSIVNTQAASYDRNNQSYQNSSYMGDAFQDYGEMPGRTRKPVTHARIQEQEGSDWDLYGGQVRTHFQKNPLSNMPVYGEILLSSNTDGRQIINNALPLTGVKDRHHHGYSVHHGYDLIGAGKQTIKNLLKKKKNGHTRRRQMYHV